MRAERLTYGTVCSGIECASLAVELLAWAPEFFAENDAFPSAVLRHRHPGTPNLGDMRGLADRIRAEDSTRRRTC